MIHDIITLTAMTGPPTHAHHRRPHLAGEQAVEKGDAIYEELTECRTWSHAHYEAFDRRDWYERDCASHCCLRLIAARQLRRVFERE